MNCLKRKHVVLVIFLFSLLVAYCVPYTHDDWDWGLQVGLNHLLYADINARYAGNLVEVLVTRSVVVKVAVMALTMTALPVIMADFSSTEEKSDTFSIILAEMLVLLMCKECWKETYGWVAGFSNYVVSMMVILFLLRELTTGYHSDRPESRMKYAGLFALCVIGQLFLENISAYMCAVTCFAFVWDRIKNKHFSKKCLVMALGCLLGAVIIFSSSIYKELLDTGYAIGEYRQLSNMNGIGGTIKNYFFLLNIMYEANIRFYAAILGCICILIFYETKKNRILHISAIAAVIVLIFWLHHNGNMKYDIILSNALNVLIAVETFRLTANDRKKRKLALFMWCSAPAVLVPMAAVYVNGGRIYFGSMLFQIMFLLVLIKKIREDIPNIAVKIIVPATLILLLLSMVNYSYKYVAIKNAEISRMQTIAAALEANDKQIHLSLLPYDELIWCQNPQMTMRENFFKQFYGIPEDVQLHFG